VSGKIPAEWNSATVLPIYKKGYWYYPNYRGINLLNSCYQICPKLLNEKIRRYSKTFLKTPNLPVEKDKIELIQFLL
jgi:hypothetical protein